MPEGSLFRRFVWNTRGRVALVVIAAIVLGLHWTVGSSTSRSHAATSTGSGGAVCKTYSSGVYCSMPMTAVSYNVPDLLAQAQALDASVTDNTPMGIDAVGGSGGAGINTTSMYGGAAGSGGKAQTVLTEADWQKRFGSDMYYYIGADGSQITDPHYSYTVDATGGAATIVSAANLNSNVTPCLKDTGTTCASADAVVLVAGGGGGGGHAGATNHGGYGGAGGTAIADTSGPALAAGSDGNSGGTSMGKAGQGGSEGVGGGGGAAGFGTDNIAGKDGDDGIGGLGGAVHLYSGPSNPTFWTNALTQTILTPAAVGSHGEGGEGEWRWWGKANGSGGAGGGGWGGGGAGGCGGDDESGGGGGGGGSYAHKAITSYTGSLPTIGSNPQVIVSFITG